MPPDRLLHHPSFPLTSRGPRAATEVTGVILAGGESRRYGRNKALEPLGGIPLIERVCRVLEQLFPEVILITNTPEEYVHLKLPMHRDRIRGLGPMGGIHAALSVMRTAWGFFVACDMPSLNPAFIRYMVAQIESGVDVVIPRIQGKMEALHALYARQCLPVFERLIGKGIYQVIRVLQEVTVRYVEEGEVRALDPDLKGFVNINHPRELDALREPRP